MASNYYAQPLLETLAQAFGIQVRSAGAVVTAAQLAYAAGLLLLGCHWATGWSGAA